MLWQDFWAALALVMVIEGMMPFLSPQSMRRVFAQIAHMDDKTLRWAGLLSMVAGIVLLYLVR
ncbi:MAG: DUF2065 domain-containing protein [Gammaproteobacteria bacterium]|nr:DUF2065 domain-containing protein [Gammaproteobacteria bacterium]